MISSATFIGFIAIVLWSCLALMTAASGTVPPFQLAAMTFAIGGTCGLIYAVARGELSAFRQPWPVWLLGVGGLFGYHALYFAALRLAPPAEAGLIAYLWPLLIVLFSSLLPGEHLVLRQVIGGILGFAGVIVLFYGKSSGSFALDPHSFTGYGLALACAFVWSTYSVLSRRVKEVPTSAVAGFCLATALFAAISHMLFETTTWPANAGQWLAVLALGLGPVGLAFYVWDHGVKRGDIKLLGVASYAAPVLSTLILVVTGFANASWALALACALIVGGAMVASYKRA
ncbi:aromatic amino acid exporter YddG [Methylovirgula sp. 4M-Z18]|uniref:aromatic amino acid exporter YddG n=1 Tax=Methylovirgula sp. 4M-Z18 TaxID=2293567 RepID=UPI000E2E5B27|nr:EamA family transporter [Methylovirgula sp. 4M-Z18]RFB78551.1 EamA family transporter [Methylovirgula sp. 4M-Z18]